MTVYYVEVSYVVLVKLSILWKFVKINIIKKPCSGCKEYGKVDSVPRSVEEEEERYEFQYFITEFIDVRQQFA